MAFMNFGGSQFFSHPSRIMTLIEVFYVSFDVNAATDSRNGVVLFAFFI